MKITQTLWNKYLSPNLFFVGIIILLTGCSQIALPTTQPGAVYREETVSLPTSAPTAERTPTNTRVLSIESLTPAPTSTITPIPDETQGLVVQVMDGQTIAVVLKGDPPSRVYLVRYLGIDTPPIEDPWGAVAHETNRQMTGMKVVRLVRDKSDVDDEGRLLRYVYADDELLSIILTEQGLARAAITQPDTRFRAEISEAETRAREGKLGLWSGSPPTKTPIPSPSPASEQEEGTVEPAEITPSATITATVEPATTEEPPASDTSTNDSDSPDKVTDDNTTNATATTQPSPDSDSSDNLQGPQ